MELIKSCQSYTLLQHIYDYFNQKVTIDLKQLQNINSELLKNVKIILDEIANKIVSNVEKTNVESIDINDLVNNFR